MSSQTHPQPHKAGNHVLPFELERTAPESMHGAAESAKNVLPEVGTSSQAAHDYFQNNPSHPLIGGHSLNDHVLQGSSATVHHLTGDVFPSVDLVSHPGSSAPAGGSAPEKSHVGTSAQPHASHHESFWKKALSVAADVGIGVGAAVLAPETGGASIAAGAGMLAARGAAMTVAEGVKSKMFGEKFDWSPGSLAKDTLINSASLGLGKYVLPEVVGAFGRGTAADTTEQIASKLKSTPETAPLDQQAQTTLEDRLSKTYAKATLAGSLPESEIQNALKGIAPTGTKEFNAAASVIEENTADHVVTPSQIDSTIGRVAAQAKLKSAEAGINIAGGMAINTILAPIKGHFNASDVTHTLVGGSTVPAYSLARDIAEESKPAG